MSDGRLLIALQFWERDKKHAMAVARLMADLEPEHSTQADFLFCARFDCTHDEDTVKYVSRKFNVRTMVSRRRGTGWPHGCNCLFFASVDHIYEHIVAGKFPKYKAILVTEADSFPVVPDWLAKLHAAWDAAKVIMLGCLCPFPNPHINGNCLISADLEFLHFVSRKLSGCSPHGGWDYILAPMWEKMGYADCPLMRSLYAFPTLPADTFDNLLRAGVVYIHGIKDLSPIDLVRKRFPLVIPR